MVLALGTPGQVWLGKVSDGWCGSGDVVVTAIIVECVANWGNFRWLVSSPVFD